LQHPVFVGDTPGDQTAARDCGVPFLHAAYGFGECADAEHRFPSFSALTSHLLTQTPSPPHG